MSDPQEPREPDAPADLAPPSPADPPPPPLPPSSVPVPVPAAGVTKPGRVEAIAIMALVDGILNIFWAGSLFFGLLGIGIATFGLGCLLLPLAAYPLVLAIFEIQYAMKLLPQQPGPVEPAPWLAVMQICNIITGDLISLGVGIVTLIFFREPEVEGYFASLRRS